MRTSQDTSRPPAAQAAGRFLAPDEVPLHYRDEGCGPAVVLVHGWPLDLEMWNPQVAALSDRFRLLRWDRRGFGRSGGLPSLEADVRDLGALLDHAGAARGALLGMSQGARVALSFAAAAPERTACLILDGAPGDAQLVDGEWEEEIPLARYRGLLQSGGIAALRSALAAHPLMRLRTCDPAARRLLEGMLARYAAADLRTPGATRAAAESVRPVLPLLPALVLNGAHDTAQRLRAGDALHAQLPGAAREIIPQAGHLANLDNGPRYNAALARFLMRHLPARPETDGELR